MNRNLNIALLSLHSCPCCKPGSRYNGGMSIYIRELAQKLASYGHAIDIYTAAHSDEEHAREISIAEGVRLIHVDCGYPESLTPPDLEKWVTCAIGLINTQSMKYDLIHSNYWLSGLAGLKLARLWAIPHVTMFHTLASLKNKAGLGTVEPDLRLESETAIAAGSDAIIASTEREVAELVSSYQASAQKVYTVPCGVNICAFRPMERQAARDFCDLGNAKIGLFVGRTDPVKGLDRLLTAVNRLDRTDFQLVIIGGEDSKNHRSSSTSDTSQANTNINFVGPVSYQEMIFYYNSADFCIIPSYYESFSLVALESLACGIPILSTDVGGIKKVVGDCNLCRVIPACGEDRLTAEIAHMLDNGQSGCSSRQELRSLIYEYSWDRIANKVLSIYSDSLNQSHCRMATGACCY